MRIIHVEDFFHPDAGYQINILPKMMSDKGHEVFVITSEMEKVPENLTSFFTKENIEERDKEYEKSYRVKIIRVPIYGFFSGRAFFKGNLFNILNELQPDIVYVHGNDTLTGIRFLKRLKKLKFPIVMDSHMLEMASENKFSRYFRNYYKSKITPTIIKNKIPIIRTQNDLYVEKHLGIPLYLAPWISVGSDTLLFNIDNKIREDFRTEHQINKDDFVIVYSGKLDEAKGGLLLGKLLKSNFNTSKKVTVMIIGNTSGEYGNKVEDELNISENRILRFPTQKYNELHKFYKAADLAIFPKQCSLSFYDVQACGLPVVSEDNNINVDRLKYNNGLAFKSNDLNDFKSKIEYFINLPTEEFNKIRLNSFNFIREKYDYSKIVDTYLAILSDEVEKFECKERNSRINI